MALPLVETTPKSISPSRSEEGEELVLCSPAGNNTSITDLPPALISEILRRLDAKDLGIISCVSTFLNALATDNQGWRRFYHDRWGPPSSATPNAASWKVLFLERDNMSRALMGRYTVDTLRGHTDAVRSVFVLASAGLAFTGGYDSVVRSWDLEAEGLFVAASRPLGCTIRAIAADMDLLVAGGTDAFLQCWRAVPGHPHVFDITEHCGGGGGHDFRLHGHDGPVTSLALDPSKIYSGSWDMTVRIWDRTTANFTCLLTLPHGDWVWSLAPRGGTVASAAGRDVYVWEVDGGRLRKVIEDAHGAGNAVSLARSYSGDLLFSGGEDGAIHMFEVDDGEDSKPIATWIPHSGAVTSLAFEFPWLVSCSSDGRLALIDVRKLLDSRGRNGRKSGVVVVEAPQRMLHGNGCNLFSVSIGADRIACGGGEEGSVRVWNFSRALEVERRARDARRARVESRMSRRRRLDDRMEVRKKVGRSGRCSVAAKRDQLNGNGGGGLVDKLKA